MKRTLKINIECGDTTCGHAKGKRCPHLVTRRFGTIHECGVFNVKLFNENGSFGGWIQRCRQCIDAEGEDWAVMLGGFRVPHVTFSTRKAAVLYAECYLRNMAWRIVKLEEV